MESTSEEELVTRSRRGDLEAFNEIVLAYQSRVYNLVARMVGDPAAAEDVTQEAFVSAYRAMARFRGGNLRAWLLRIAANAARDYLRSRRRRREQSLEADPPRTAALASTRPQDSPEEAALRSELAGLLQEAIHSLPPDQREVVVLVDLQGLDYAEAAQVAGVSLGTVKSRLSRARARLRDYLRDRGELLPHGFRQS